jgi:AraC family transcriptional regulator, regulatory protein of adaptative response / DNA-3-methyladenine glycosylase II
MGTMSVQAVTTTGIYCVPSCSARPHPGNVVRYGSPAAAEAAGFRACLRCRPYRSAPVMLTGPELVCRAVQLIGEGALDGGTEDDLARRLGVSARHLRRLFAEHVGTTPDRLARSHRTHFARRLLDDTDLTVTDIAWASGFGSLRQLNRACQEIFRASPTELRARRRRSDRLVADGGLVLRLPFHGPLDWDLMLGYFERRAIAGVEHVTGGTYRRTITVDGDPGVLEVTRGGSDNHLVLRAHLPHVGGLIHVVQGARRIFALDRDPSEADRHLAADPVLAPLVTASPGLRVPGTWDAYETGVRAIVGQQVSVAGASTVTARIVERIGRRVPGLEPFGLTHTFPDPSTLAAADLDGIGMPGARATAIKAFAGAVDKGDVPLDGSLPLDDLLAAICAVPGLGPWTAGVIALRLGEPDTFPAADLGLRRAANPGGEALTTTELAARAEAWRPHRAAAALRLWLSESGG